MALNPEAVLVHNEFEPYQPATPDRVPTLFLTGLYGHQFDTISKIMLNNDRTESARALAGAHLQRFEEESRLVTITLHGDNYQPFIELLEDTLGLTVQRPQ